MTDVKVTISPKHLSDIQAILDSGSNLWRAYEIVAGYSDQLGSERAFWFLQASNINKMANGWPVSSDQNSAGNFILSYSAIGLYMDDANASLSDTSDGIARSVIRDIINNGGVRPIGEMIGNDILSSLTDGNQSIGGWGGAFYYWDVVLPQTAPSGMAGKTVGQLISSDAIELEKFIASAAAATVHSMASEVYGPYAGGEVFKAVVSGWNAEAPLV